MMRRGLTALALSLGLWACGSVAALAHPHVWVTIRSEVVYAPDGSATGVRHHWTFDEMFSTFAVQGMDAKKPGGLTRADLAPLAEVNITSLREFDFFTYARADGKKTPFVDPTDYWLDMKDGVLTLNFTLPFKSPAKAKKLGIEIYDPTYFVDFSLDKEAAVSLVGAAADCKLDSSGRRDSAGPQGKVSEDFFQNLDKSSSWGAQFANRISVTCP
jgi:ABC-type uncharacterized transport system substrate-binding protein